MSTEMLAPQTDPEHSLQAFHEQDLVWGPHPQHAGVHLTHVRVPLDYTDPHRAEVSIGVARVPAPDPQLRIGTLVIAPDDPGNRGIALLAELMATLPTAVTDRFDLVAFDHRFSGESDPIQVDWTPDERLWVFHRPQSLESEMRFQARIAAKVNAAAGDLLPYASTRNIARDLDVVRVALGLEQISYLGYSYGTYLGLVYAQMFGEHVDRMVLDSVLGPDWPWRGLFLNVAANVESAVLRWCEWAAARDSEFGLGATGREVRDGYDRLLERVGGQPIRISGLPMPVDRFGLEFFTVVLLTSDTTYPLLAEVIAAAVHGRPVGVAALELLMAMVNQRADSTPAGQLALLCGESEWPRDPEFYEQEMQRAAAETPFIGRTLAGVRAGAFWPVRPVEPLTTFDRPGAASVLLVQSEMDVFTGVGGARRVRDLLPETSRLVLVPGRAAHRVFPFGAFPEVNQVVVNYLETGRLPSADLSVDTEAVA